MKKAYFCLIFSLIIIFAFIPETVLAESPDEIQVQDVVNVPPAPVGISAPALIGGMESNPFGSYEVRSLIQFDGDYDSALVISDGQNLYAAGSTESVYQNETNAGRKPATTATVGESGSYYVVFYAAEGYEFSDGYVDGMTTDGIIVRYALVEFEIAEEKTLTETKLTLDKSEYAGKSGSTITVKAVLTDADGEPVSGCSIDVYIDGGLVSGKYVSDENGTVTIKSKWSQKGTHSIYAAFAGNEQYGSSVSGESQIVIKEESAHSDIADTQNGAAPTGSNTSQSGSTASESGTNAQASGTTVSGGTIKTSGTSSNSGSTTLKSSGRRSTSKKSGNSLALTAVKTADESNAVLWILVLITAGFGIVVYRRDRI